MRTLIILVVGLLAVGCETLTPEQRQKALRDSVVGEYEFKDEDGTTHREVFLGNGINEYFENGTKRSDRKWEIADGKIHAIYKAGDILVFRINKDKSITWIAIIVGTYRDDFPKKDLSTYKKIKKTVKELTPEDKNAVGEYKYIGKDGDALKMVFLVNGIVEAYENDEKQERAKWTMIKEEIHIIVSSEHISVFRINKDRSITFTAKIVDGKRTGYPKGGLTYKKIK